MYITSSKCKHRTNPFLARSVPCCCRKSGRTLRTGFSLSLKTSRLMRDGTAKLVSGDQILRREREQGNIYTPCSVDHEQDDWQPYQVDPYCAISDDHTLFSHDSFPFVRETSRADYDAAYRKPRIAYSFCFCLYITWSMGLNVLAYQSYVLQYCHPACGHEGYSHLSPVLAL